MHAFTPTTLTLSIMYGLSVVASTTATASASHQRNQLPGQPQTAASLIFPREDGWHSLPLSQEYVNTIGNAIDAAKEICNRAGDYTNRLVLHKDGQTRTIRLNTQLIDIALDTLAYWGNTTKEALLHASKTNLNLGPQAQADFYESQLKKLREKVWGSDSYHSASASSSNESARARKLRLMREKVWKRAEEIYMKKMDMEASLLFTTGTTKNKMVFQPRTEAECTALERLYALFTAPSPAAAPATSMRFEFKAGNKTYPCWIPLGTHATTFTSAQAGSCQTMHITRPIENWDTALLANAQIELPAIAASGVKMTKPIEQFMANRAHAIRTPLALAELVMHAASNGFLGKLLSTQSHPTISPIKLAFRQQLLESTLLKYYLEGKLDLISFHPPERHKKRAFVGIPDKSFRKVFTFASKLEDQHLYILPEQGLFLYNPSVEKNAYLRQTTDTLLNSNQLKARIVFDTQLSNAILAYRNNKVAQPLWSGRYTELAYARNAIQNTLAHVESSHTPPTAQEIKRFNLPPASQKAEKSCNDHLYFDFTLLPSSILNDPSSKLDDNTYFPSLDEKSEVDERRSAFTGALVLSRWQTSESIENSFEHFFHLAGKKERATLSNLMRSKGIHYDEFLCSHIGSFLVKKDHDNTILFTNVKLADEINDCLVYALKKDIQRQISHKNLLRDAYEEKAEIEELHRKNSLFLSQVQQSLATAQSYSSRLTNDTLKSASNLLNHVIFTTFWDRFPYKRTKSLAFDRLISAIAELNSTFVPQNETEKQGLGQLLALSESLTNKRTTFEQTLARARAIDKEIAHLSYPFASAITVKELYKTIPKSLYPILDAWKADFNQLIKQWQTELLK